VRVSIHFDSTPLSQRLVHARRRRRHVESATLTQNPIRATSAGSEHAPRTLPHASARQLRQEPIQRP
jgi:hypothetical protein